MFEQLPLFVAATLLMLVVPGPDFVLVTRNAVTGSRRQALLTAAGICAGLAALTLLAASGLAAAIAADPAMLMILRIAGGAYLLLLGVLAVRAAWSRRGQQAENSAAPERGRSPLAQGFLNNVLNPKALIFQLTLLPQFLVPPGPPVFAQTLVLGAVAVACAALWWTFYILVIAHVRAAFAGGRARTALDVGAGAALSGLGVVALLGGP